MDDLIIVVTIGVCLWSIVLFIVLSIPIRILLDHRRLVKTKEEICRDSFVYYKEFEKCWIGAPTSKDGARDGFKYQDGSGCYIITIYSDRVTDGNWRKYENVYVGQSKMVYQRVHNHFNGRGNGDVYADIKHGKWVYVSFVRCEDHELNDTEIKLIAICNARKSYNKTRGGSVIR